MEILTIEIFSYQARCLLSLDADVYPKQCYAGNSLLGSCTDENKTFAFDAAKQLKPLSQAPKQMTPILRLHSMSC